MSEDSTGAGGDSTDDFTEQARHTGLTLPTRKRTNPWDVVAVCAVIILVSLAIGASTGWLNLRPASSSTPPGLLGTQACGQQAGQKVALRGSVPSDSDPPLTASLGLLADDFSSSYGGCVEVTYLAPPAGDGLSSLLAKEVDFSVLQNGPTEMELHELPDPSLVLPAGVTSVSILYHLPGVAGGLNLSGTVLEGIYAGTITSWSDPAIARLNPGTALPEGLPISVVYRSDATPVNSAFTQFLADANNSWNTTVGVGLQVAWPAGTGTNSSGEMTGLVSSTVGAIGYVETGTTVPSGLGVAQIENLAGNFMAPDENSVATAAATIANATKAAGANWTGASVLDAPGSDSYPLVMLTYLVLYQDYGTAFGGNLSFVAVQWELTFLWWEVTDGGYVTASTGFVGLAAATVTTTQELLEKVTYHGVSLLEGAEGNETGNETGEL